MKKRTHKSKMYGDSKEPHLVVIHLTDLEWNWLDGMNKKQSRRALISSILEQVVKDDMAMMVPQ